MSRLVASAPDRPWRHQQGVHAPFARSHKRSSAGHQPSSARQRHGAQSEARPRGDAQLEEPFENVFENYYAKLKIFIQKYINEGDELVSNFLEMKTSQEYMIPLAIH